MRGEGGYWESEGAAATAAGGRRGQPVDAGPNQWGLADSSSAAQGHAKQPQDRQGA